MLSQTLTGADQDLVTGKQQARTWSAGKEAIEREEDAAYTLMGSRGHQAG